MIQHLTISNFTLIDHLDVDFHPGFSVITGETGAGKSIILGAIRLLLGQRAEAQMLKNHERKCVIEATFHVGHYNLDSFFSQNDLDNEGEQCSIRREITPAGKSRAFINDTPVSLQQLKELGNHLVDIHSQHQNLLITNDDFQLGVLDTMNANDATRTEYKRSFAEYRRLKQQLNEQQEKLDQLRQQEDFLRYQLTELEELNLQPTDQEDLEEELQQLEHVEEIKSALYESTSVLSEQDHSVIELLRQSTRALQSVASVYAKADTLVERLHSAEVELKDITAELEDGLENTELDPARLDQVRDRLDNIYTLERKHHVDTAAELIAIRDRMRESLRHIDLGDEEIKALNVQVTKAHEQCQQQAQQLSSERHQAARVVEDELTERLSQLGMPHVRFKVQIEERPMDNNGSDNVCFMFSANSSTALRPVAQTASGGEVARVMFALKAMMATRTAMPTIIFDEVDTGISGRVAETMGQQMHRMAHSGEQQIVSITHLPQIAAAGDNHYKVQKDDDNKSTQTSMRQLSAEERINEIAQMLSGNEITEAARENACALLKISD